MHLLSCKSFWSHERIYVTDELIVSWFYLCKLHRYRYITISSSTHFRRIAVVSFTLEISFIVLVLKYHRVEPIYFQVKYIWTERGLITKSGEEGTATGQGELLVFYEPILILIQYFHRSQLYEYMSTNDTTDKLLNNWSVSFRFWFAFLLHFPYHQEPQLFSSRCDRSTTKFWRCA